MKTTTRLELIENLYGRYNKRESSAQDPVHFLEAYEDVRDREVAAMIASALAYGRVAHIMRSVSLVLDRIGSPADFVRRSSRPSLARTFAGFRHRFASGLQLAELLNGIRHIIERYESLEACFGAAMQPEFTTIAPAMRPFVRELRVGMKEDCGHLLPVPENGSACKRLALFMRWMVRCDTVDIGGWTCLPTSKLIIPLDTHMNRIGQALDLTARKSPDMRSALEITDSLRVFAPDDPVKYDFALMRLSMESGDRLQQFVAAWRKSKDKAHA